MELGTGAYFEPPKQISNLGISLQKAIDNIKKK